MADRGADGEEGDPLIELYSKELAEAKSICEIEKIQWIYELNLLAARRELIKTNAISAQIFLESQNNEMKSRREYEVARDKLLVFGLSDGEVDAIDREVGTQKARMTLRSPSDGIVIERDVVPGNLYDENDNLLVIAPMDHLWVWGNVFESDQDLVRLGQDWEIQFPFLDRSLPGKVEYISNRVDPSTHAVRIRTSIQESRRPTEVGHAGSRDACRFPRSQGVSSSPERPSSSRGEILRLRPHERAPGYIRASRGERRA